MTHSWADAAAAAAAAASVALVLFGMCDSCVGLVGFVLQFFFLLFLVKRAATMGTTTSFAFLVQCPKIEIRMTLLLRTFKSVATISSFYA